MSRHRHYLFLLTVCFVPLPTTSQTPSTQPLNDTTQPIPHWATTVTFPDYSCHYPPTTSFFFNPYGCQLCTKRPLDTSEIPPKYITNVPGAVPQYSTWANEAVNYLYWDDLKATGLMPWGGNETLPPDEITPSWLKDKWERRPNIPCACFGWVLSSVIRDDVPLAVRPTACAGDEFVPNRTDHTPYIMVWTYDCRRTRGVGGVMEPELHCTDGGMSFQALGVDTLPEGDGALFLPPDVGGGGGSVTSLTTTTASSAIPTPTTMVPPPTSAVDGGTGPNGPTAPTPSIGNPDVPPIPSTTDTRTPTTLQPPDNSNNTPSIPGRADTNTDGGGTIFTGNPGATPSSSNNIPIISPSPTSPSSPATATSITPNTASSSSSSSIYSLSPVTWKSLVSLSILSCIIIFYIDI